MEWGAGVPAGEGGREERDPGEKDEDELGRAGAPRAPFTHPFIQQKREASRAPRTVLGAPGEAAVGRQASFGA